MIGNPGTCRNSGISGRFEKSKFNVCACRLHCRKVVFFFSQKKNHQLDQHAHIGMKSGENACSKENDSGIRSIFDYFICQKTGPFFCYI